MTTDTRLRQATDAIRSLQYDEAIALLTELVADHSGGANERWLLARCFENKNDTASALEQFDALLEHVGHDLHAIDQIAGHMRQRRYPLDSVLQAYADYLAERPESATAAFNYAYNLARDAQFDAAIEMYRRSLGLGIDRPEEVHLNIANVCMDHLHDHDRARSHLREALELNPGYAAAFYNLGNLCEQEGARDEASRSFSRCLELDPGNESALARLADTQRFDRQDDPLLARLVAAARGSDNSDVHFALGKALEQLRDYEGAWRHFSKGNALDERMTPGYEPKRVQAQFRDIEALCGREWLDRFEGTSDETVFICGMFRSGSTLLEQMLASHPGFAAGGESEFFPRLVARHFPGYPQGLDAVSGDQLRDWRQRHGEQLRQRRGAASRVTDKRPDNVLYLGLIKAVLPAAKLVVTERDWRDIATSVFSVRLGPSQSWATNLENIRHYSGMQTKLVDHWQRVLGDDLVRVRYEDLVLRPRETLTELLEWLGESWDERCLQFHELQNEVKTASVWQVREPLHGKSIGRWRNYEQQFVEVFGPAVNS